MNEVSVSALLAHTQDMMLAVIEQNWESLPRLHSAQDSMIRALFSSPDRLFNSEEQEGLVEVQRLNSEIITAVESHKTDIAQQLRALQQGKNKANAYQSY